MRVIQFEMMRRKFEFELSVVTSLFKIVWWFVRCVTRLLWAFVLNFNHS